MWPDFKPNSGPVRLVPHDDAWATAAELEADRIRFVLGKRLLRVHHIGSTAIEGIAAKPIVDLIPVVTSLEVLDAMRERVEAIGYQWWGEYGIAGRRYCTFNDPQNGTRLFNVHFYADGNSEIERHLAFRDYLRANPSLAQEYEALKRRLASEFSDVNDYAEAKTPWIRSIEPTALEFYHSRA